MIKKHETLTDNSPLRTHKNKTENRITGYLLSIYLALSRTFNVWNDKITESTENKITKDNNGEKVPHLKIIEVLFVYCNIVNNEYQH